MIKVIICDDDQFICNNLKGMLLKYAKENNETFEIKEFYSSEDLCTNMKEEVDLIFLDIEFNGTSGVEAGHIIRYELKNYATQIVYISHASQYAMELFKIRPFDFLVKPINYEQFEDLVNRFRTQLAYSKDYVTCVINKKAKRVPYKDILYLHSQGRQVTMVKKDGKLSFYGKLSKVENQLVHKRFLVIHKSYIININYISAYTYDYVEMINGDILNISNDRKKDVRTKLLEWKTKD